MRLNIPTPPVGLLLLILLLPLRVGRFGHHGHRNLGHGERYVGP